MQQLSFYGEMGLGIVSELFEHMPVHLRLRKLWLRWEQFCQSEANYSNMFF